jgi:hypothetical protein
MPYRINHTHLKAPDPRKTAEWYTKAFNAPRIVFSGRSTTCASS